MRIETCARRRSVMTMLVMACLIAGFGALAAGGASAADFKKSLARVDKALKRNPNFVAQVALESCQDRRNTAAALFRSGQRERAERSIKYCYRLLGIPEVSDEDDDTDAEKPDPKVIAEEQKRKKREKATREFSRSLALEPNIENGLEIYRGCAACHGAEGWGMAGAAVPQIAGQHRKVVISQLADIRAGSRENRVMDSYSSVERIGGAQAVADVAGYIDTLEISVENGKGPGDQLALGRELYEKNCVSCHGMRGEGDAEKRIPRIQSQHYHYLVTQFADIRAGRRYVETPEMRAFVKDLDEQQIAAIMDYVSRLEPPKELQAPPGWRNPDFDQPYAGN